MLRYRRFSDNQKSQMWERWRQGDTLREIARLLERPRKKLDYETPAERFEACRAAVA